MRKLKPNDDAHDAVRRYLRRGIRKALELLKREPLTDEAVHDIRRKLKKLRAVLRLARGGMSRKRFHRINLCLRNAGAPLSELRDAKVLVTTWKELCGSEGSFPELREPALSVLEERLESARKHVLGAGAVIDTVSDNLRRARKLVSSWPSSRMEMSTLEDGLRRAHSRGCEALRAAIAHPSDDAYHELRKRAKDLHNASAFLQKAARGEGHSLLTSTGRIGELLRDDRDLAMLTKALDGEHGDALGDRVRIREVAAARRRPLKREALRLARRTYSPAVHGQPRRFLRG